MEGELAMFKCSCGRAFAKRYQLDNHIGMFILLNDNADKHFYCEGKSDERR